MSYCQTLARSGAKLVGGELGTEVLENGTGTLGAECCLANVKLPLSVAKAREYAKKAGIEEADVGASVRDWVNRTLVEEYGTFIPSLFFGGAWWARLSGQVYLDMRDMETGAKALKEVCARAERGEWVGKGSKL